MNISPRVRGSEENTKIKNILSLYPLHYPLPQWFPGTKGLTTKSHKESLKGDGNVFIVAVVLFIHIHTCQTHQIIYFKWMQLMVYITPQ